MSVVTTGSMITVSMETEVSNVSVGRVTFTGGDVAIGVRVPVLSFVKVALPSLDESILSMVLLGWMANVSSGFAVSSVLTFAILLCVV